MKLFLLLQVYHLITFEYPGLQSMLTIMGFREVNINYLLILILIILILILSTECAPEELWE